MTTDPDRPAVPGLEPADGRTRPLDLSKDPDRFDPAADAAAAPPELPRGLDPKHDPDRYVPPGQGQTLMDLLGKEGSQQGERDNYQWVAGLLGVFLFLALVAWLFNSVLTP